MKERWKQLRNSDHEVSDRGRVRSHVFTRWRQSKTWIRTLHINEDGYAYVQLKIGDQKRFYRVHRLVLEAFVGPCPPGQRCRHLNGKRADNRLKNLKWGTVAEDYQDRVTHGTSNLGARNGNAKLTWHQVEAIRHAQGPYGLNTKLAKRYGVKQHTISRIRSNKGWLPYAKVKANLAK